MQRRPVFIATHQLFSTRYFLSSGILASLKKSGTPVVVISPNAENSAFRQMFEDEFVKVERYRYEEHKKYSSSKLHNFFVRVRSLTLPDEHDITTIRTLTEARELLKMQRLTFVRKCWLDIQLGLSRLLRKSLMLRQLFVLAERRLFTSASHKDLFEKYQPALLVIGDIGTIQLSNFLISEAQKHDVPVISVVLSWDNLTSKGMGGILPENAIAWNENMKNELIRYHNVRPENIYVGGIAHFDDYFRKPKWQNEKSFQEEYGLSPDRKILFYGTNTPGLFRHNKKLIRLLLSAIKSNKLCEPCQVLVRLHPAFFTKYKNQQNKALQEILQLQAEYAGLLAISTPVTIDQEYGAVQSKEDQMKLAAILSYSDVLINIFSTLMLEACIFDLPVINVGFYQFANMNCENHMLQNWTHIKRIIDYGAVRIAYNEKELYEQINMYLADGSTDRAARMKVRENEAGPNKGRAGEAVAAQVLSLAGHENSINITGSDSIQIVDEPSTKGKVIVDV